MPDSIGGDLFTPPDRRNRSISNHRLPPVRWCRWFISLHGRGDHESGVFDWGSQVPSPRLPSGASSRSDLRDLQEQSSIQGPTGQCQVEAAKAISRRSFRAIDHSQRAGSPALFLLEPALLLRALPRSLVDTSLGTDSNSVLSPVIAADLDSRD